MQKFFVFLIISSFCFTVTADDYYSVLGVSPTSSQKEIKTAYRRLHMQFHPDRVSVSGIAEEQAEEMTKAINEAYSALSDPVERHSYDVDLRRGTQNASNTVNDNEVTIFWALKRRIHGEITAEEYKSIFKEHINSLENSFKNGEITFWEYRSLLGEYKGILRDSFKNREIATFREYRSLLKENGNHLRTNSVVATVGTAQILFGAFPATNLMAEDVTLLGFVGGAFVALGAVNLCAAAFKYKKQKE